MKKFLRQPKSFKTTNIDKYMQSSLIYRTMSPELEEKGSNFYCITESENNNIAKQK